MKTKGNWYWYSRRAANHCEDMGGLTMAQKAGPREKLPGGCPPLHHVRAGDPTPCPRARGTSRHRGSDTQGQGGAPGVRGQAGTVGRAQVAAAPQPVLRRLTSRAPR
jgi:hypothetical protein